MSTFGGVVWHQMYTWYTLAGSYDKGGVMFGLLHRVDFVKHVCYVLTENVSFNCINKLVICIIGNQYKNSNWIWYKMAGAMYVVLAVMVASFAAEISSVSDEEFQVTSVNVRK